MSSAQAEDWERVSLRMPKSMLEELDGAVEFGAASNRSEAIRECVRRADLEAMYR